MIKLKIGNGGGLVTELFEKTLVPRHRKSLDGGLKKLITIPASFCLGKARVSIINRMVGIPHQNLFKSIKSL